MKTKHKVFITASNSLSCGGRDNRELFCNILEKKSGIEQDSNYFFNATPAIGKFPIKGDFYTLLTDQCQKLLKESALSNFSETLLIVGSSVGGMLKTEEIFFTTESYKDIDPHMHEIQSIAYRLNSVFSFYDDISFSTACTSSANALGYAYEVLSKGIYKSALVVGADSLTQTTVGGFLTLGVLSSAPCRPFDADRKGMNVAEGMAFLLLERESRDDVSVELCGVGYSSDAYHITHPHPEGEGAFASMEQALDEANIEATQIAYINAHGTGTLANDKAEANAIERLFPHKPFVGSTKSITGHTLGAAGALEAIIASKVILEEIIPPNSFLENPENSEINFSKKKENKRISYVMSNSFAFGGNNCSLIFGRVE